MISDNLDQLRRQIRQLEQSAQRKPGSVMLVAVSKTQPASVIAQAYRAGQRHFGENYVQEAIAKQRELAAYAITWHFIGPIQSNKTRFIAEHFSWVHSVDSFKVAKRLSDQRPPQLPPLNMCVQVNISEECSKSGILLDDLPVFCRQVSALSGLNLRGVMAIPAATTELIQQREPYRRLYDTVRSLDLAKPLDALSYGMSGDIKAAILEGATIVRIGTALFGARN